MGYPNLQFNCLILLYFEGVKCVGRYESEGDYWLEVLPKNPMSLSSTKQSVLFTPRIKALLITGTIPISKCLTKTGLKSCQNAFRLFSAVEFIKISGLNMHYGRLLV